MKSSLRKALLIMLISASAIPVQASSLPVAGSSQLFASEVGQLFVRIGVKSFIKATVVSAICWHFLLEYKKKQSKIAAEAAKRLEQQKTDNDDAESLYCVGNDHTVGMVVFRLLNGIIITLNAKSGDDYSLVSLKKWLWEQIVIEDKKNGNSPELRSKDASWISIISGPHRISCIHEIFNPENTGNLVVILRDPSTE